METQSLMDLKELEDGEIDNCSSFDEVYVPLERPSCIATAVSKGVVESDVDDNEHPTTTDSDSDSSNHRAKLSKIRRKIKSYSSTKAKISKNCKIWSTVLEAEAVTSNLTNCNIDETQERIRGLVPYDYTGKYVLNHNRKYNYNEPYRGQKSGSHGKRNYEGHQVNERKFFQDTIVNLKAHKGVSKDIPPLSDNARDSEEKLAKEIANNLNETKEDLILRAVEVAGMETAISIYEETRQIERNGGLLIMNGSRRRSSGGVFFFLLKTSDGISDEKQKEIFIADKRETSTQKKKTARQIRKNRSAKLKEALCKDDFPTLLSRTELAIREFKERKKAEESAEVENPPPSPATDGRDCSSDGEEEKCNASSETGQARKLTTYDDDLFGGAEDVQDMDVL